MHMEWYMANRDVIMMIMIIIIVIIYSRLVLWTLNLVPTDVIIPIFPTRMEALRLNTCSLPGKRPHQTHGLGPRALVSSFCVTHFLEKLTISC